jgi:hypothetical protein
LCGRIVSVADDCLKSSLDFGARQKNPTIARQAAETDIGAQAHNTPFVSPTGMGLAQAYNIIEVQL